MPDYTEGIKRDVAEIKFLIHDLRVERFINEVIHFHVTLNTDLELYGIDQAQIIHGHDLKVLKEKAVSLRKAYQDFSNAVKNLSPDRTVLLTGQNYVNTIYSACDLILNPLWGRADRILSFLPHDCRSAKDRAHYFNCISWIRGVHNRIKQFLAEQIENNVEQEFDIAVEVEAFTRNVVCGYVMEHSSGRVQIELDQLDHAILRGKVARFRRMFFNLVMNAVDAMANRDVGVLTVGDSIEDDSVILTVTDNGSGMPTQKIEQLLRDKDTLDGELHSLGFVFVRQTVRDFGGDLQIESEVGRGTRIRVRFPCLPGRKAVLNSMEDLESPGNRVIGALTIRPVLETVSPAVEVVSKNAVPSEPSLPKSADIGTERWICGRTLLEDYEKSDAQHPGAIFAISFDEQGKADFFSHAPYEKYWDIQHQDLAPMLYESVIRGRLEQDENRLPQLTLKAPISLFDYFDFKNVPEELRTPDRYVSMVHDEYILVGRKLIETGLSPQITVLLDRLGKFFPGRQDLLEAEPFSLRFLADQRLTTEQSEQLQPA
jgi:two-component sensor histidine kinase